jgi:hypothetical protein
VRITTRRRSFTGRSLRAYWTFDLRVAGAAAATRRSSTAG